MVVGSNRELHASDIFYGKIKNLKDVCIKLKLTKRWHGVLKVAVDLVEEHPDLDHFLDVNCQLQVIFKDGLSKFFTDIDKSK